MAWALLNELSRGSLFSKHCKSVLWYRSWGVIIITLTRQCGNKFNKKLVKVIRLFFRVTMSNNAKGLNSKQPFQAATMVGDYEPPFDQIWRPLFITRFKHVNDWTYVVYCCLSCNTIFRYELNLFEWKYVTSCKTDHNAIHCYIYTVLLLNLYIILII